MSKKKKFYPIIVTVLILFAIYFLGRLIPEEALRSLIDDAGIFGPFLLVLLILLANIIAPLSSSPILLVGYYAYGRNIIFLASAAALVSFVTNFWIARKFGRSLVEKFAGKESMRKMDKLTNNYGLVALFFLRLFQGAIHDFISYAAGLTSMKFSSYIIVSSLALAPHTLIWYLFSLKVSNPFSFIAITAIMTFSLSFLFILFTLAATKSKKSKN